MDNDPKRRSWFVKLIFMSPLFILGILFSLSFSHGLQYTNEMSFCTSCHTMKINLEEYKKTPHYKSASGVRATCSDCHVPKPFVPKMIAKVIAAKDVWHEIIGTIGTKEKYEQHRWRMANVVWDKMKANDSRECRSCHSWDAMDLNEQDKQAKKKHPRAMKQGKTCIDCHKGIAHEEPDEPDDVVVKQTSSVAPSPGKPSETKMQ